MSSAFRRSLPAVLVLATPLLFSAENGAKLTYEQKERFLETAQIVKVKDLSVGVTNSRRATLSDGTVTHDAHVQTIDEAKSVFQTDRGSELNFRDTWKFNVAAYRLGRMLELDMIPPSVERKVAGTSAAVTWWEDNTMMEGERIKQHLSAPDKDAWNDEMYIVRVFDQLIFNTDRNLQNLLVDKESYRIWMIDHTRAFRLQTGLQEKKNLVKCDRQLLAKLRTLDAEKLNKLEPYVNRQEIKGLLARRDKIVQFFDSEVAKKGEGAVLYDRPPR